MIISVKRLRKAAAAKRLPKLCIICKVNYAKSDHLGCGPCLKLARQERKAK